MTGEASYIHGLRGLPDGATVVHHAADGSIVATVEVPCDGLLPEPVMLLPGEGLSVEDDDGIVFMRYGRPLRPQSTRMVPALRTDFWRDSAPIIAVFWSIAAEVAHLTAPWPWWAFVLGVLAGGAGGRYAGKRALRRAKRRAGL